MDFSSLIILCCNFSSLCLGIIMNGYNGLGKRDNPLRYKTVV